MSGVYKRATDKARGKQGKWTAWWMGADGKRHSRVAFTDKAASLKFASNMEVEAMQVRYGLVDTDQETYREQARRPIAELIEEWRAHMSAQGRTQKHVDHYANVVARLARDGQVGNLSDWGLERTGERMANALLNGSARTRNHARGALGAFARWLRDTGRTPDEPRWIARLPRARESTDQRYKRRALTSDELVRLLKVSGVERAMAYRLATITGFRANEIRNLRHEDFHLDGPDPAITVRAASAKNRKEVRQPIGRAHVSALKRWLKLRRSCERPFDLPEKTAKMMRPDLEAAGIPYKTPEGVVDFHSLRAYYVTDLIRRGCNIKVVQTLARHSTPAITLALYAKVTPDDLRKAVDG